MRLVSWNVDGLVPARVPEMLARFGAPDVLCLQEARIRASDAPLIEALVAAGGDAYACHHSLNRDPTNVRFRGGRAYGVVTYVRATLDPALRGEVPEWDREGRIVLTHLPALGLVIGNVYAVNGTSKPYFDHELGRVDGDRHAFKRRFQELVLEEARRLRPAIFAGDWNVSRTTLDVHPRLRTEEPHARARAELEVHLSASEMVDVFRELHPHQRAYSWFCARAAARGRLDAARVDYVLVSKELVPRVREATILDDPSHRPGSDHAPLTLTLEDRVSVRATVDG